MHKIVFVSVGNHHTLCATLCTPDHLLGVPHPQPPHCGTPYGHVTDSGQELWAEVVRLTLEGGCTVRAGPRTKKIMTEAEHQLTHNRHRVWARSEHVFVISTGI